MTGWLIDRYVYVYICTGRSQTDSLCAGASAGMEDDAASLSFVSLNSFVMDD